MYIIPPYLAKEYTERDELYNNLKESLRGPGNIVAAVGLGGMGKTQLALKYAVEQKGRYDSILWIDARSETAILSSFRLCAQALNLSPPSASSSESITNSPTVNSVLQWLRKRDDQNSESLLIFDNVDDLSIGVMNIIPPQLHGNIIVTSRNTQCLTLLPERSQQLDVGDLTPSEAISLFMRHLKLTTTEAPEDILDLSRQICDAMRWCALAVHLAGAQLRMNFAHSPNKNLSETKIKLEKFLRDTQSHKEEILKAETVKGLYAYKLTIYTVLDSSLEALDTMFPNLSSRRLLVLLAHIEKTDIPDSLFWYVARAIAEGQDGVAQKLPKWLRDLLLIGKDGKWDDFKIQEALKPLQQYGLLKSSQSPGFTHVLMHDLVRWKAKLDGKETQQDELTGHAIRAMFYESALRQLWVEECPDQVRDDAPITEVSRSASIFHALEITRLTSRLLCM